MDTPPPLPPPHNGRLLLIVLTTVTYLALVIALFGFVSLILDEDVIREGDAGPLLGPAMVAAACISTFVVLVRMPRRPSPFRAAFAAGASAYIVLLLVGSLGYAVSRGELIWVLLFAARYAGSPFLIGAAVLSVAVVVGFWALSPQARPGGVTGGHSIDPGPDKE